MWWVCVQTFSLNYLQPLYYYNKVTENRHQSPPPPPPSTEKHTLIEINNRNSNLHNMKLITVLFRLSAECWLEGLEIWLNGRAWSFRYISVTFHLTQWHSTFLLYRSTESDYVSLRSGADHQLNEASRLIWRSAPGNETWSGSL